MKMKGLMSLPTNIIGYVITLAIFITGLGIIGTYRLEFQTIPKENQIPEKTTACDLAYILSTWEEATVKPTIFNKTFLETWDVDETAESIFESESSKFFFPGSDLFVKIEDNEQTYTLYIPPESRETFESCTKTLVTPDSFKQAEKYGVDDIVKEFGEAPLERSYLEKATSYNELHAVCGMPAFVLDENSDNIETGKIMVGLTSNIATKIRKGIYELSVSEDPNDKERIYYLGEYPRGCIFDKGITKKEEKFEDTDDLKIWFYYSMGEIVNKVIEIESAILEFINKTWNLISSLWGGGGNGPVKIPKMKDYCGFVWDWENKTDKFLLTVEPLTPGIGNCIIKTRIPLNVVNLTNITKRLCEPRDLFLPVYWPEGGFGYGKKHFFLRIEELTYDPENEAQAKDFCKRRCSVHGGPLKNLCKQICNGGIDNLDTERILNANCYYVDTQCDSLLNCNEVIDTDIKLDLKYKLVPLYFISSVCLFVKQQIYMYRHLPENAIDIEYIIIDQKKIEEAGGSFEDVDESDYYAYESACSTWPYIFNCTTSDTCAGDQVCIMKTFQSGDIDITCDTCYGNEGYYCSPKNLKSPPNLGIPELYYTCQNVSDYTAPYRSGSFSACLPEIDISYLLLSSSGEPLKDTANNPVKEVDCNLYPNTLINWTIDASLICCREIKDGKCLGATDYCPKMKFWSNLDASKSYSLDKSDLSEVFRHTIQQRACRNKDPYNNANKYFLVAEYQQGGDRFKYVVNDSIVKRV